MLTLSILIGLASLMLGSLQLAMAFLLRDEAPFLAAANFLLSWVSAFNVLVSIGRIREHVRFEKTSRDLAKHQAALSKAIDGGNHTAAWHHYEQSQAALERMRRIVEKG